MADSPFQTVIGAIGRLLGALGAAPRPASMPIPIPLRTDPPRR